MVWGEVLGGQQRRSQSLTVSFCLKCLFWDEVQVVLDDQE